MESDETYRVRNKPDRRPRKIKDASFFYELRSAEEVGIILGLTRQRVSQIEKSALLKIRQGLLEFWKDWA